MTLTESQKIELFNSLFYLKISELKNLCKILHISCKKEKINLIETIKNYINTGKQLDFKEIPGISKSKVPIDLTPNALILYGSYKNDLNTRNFFKSLIGEHFHFTAFGIDWIKDRWNKGNPPTYAEFALFWQDEYLSRRKNKPLIKQEWAYLNFLDKYKQNNTHASRANSLKAWHQFRKTQTAKVEEILRIKLS